MGSVSSVVKKSILRGEKKDFMSDIAIKVRGLGKKYYIGEKLPQRSLAGSIKNAAGFPWKVAKSLISGKAIDQREEFWALKDVAFDVKQGEVLGIIGRNGAGKSTLLKILSRITTPTEGEGELFGRVGCLLEVGTGFHPELTGRENVFLNGSLLGMSNVEIKQRFDEIVDFSGVERFLDTPVKFYSSGMYTRLAFSVAAHLNPEILIVDEVLAVGDAEFQKKCLGKMDSIAKEGRTILFVSHNMSAIGQLCAQAIVLENGNVAFNGNVHDAISQYYHGNTCSPFSVDYTKQDSKPGDDWACLLAAHIEDMNGKHIGTADIGESFKVVISYRVNDTVPVQPNPFLNLNTSSGILAFATSGRMTGSNIPGEYQAHCIIPGNFLNNDTYSIDIGLVFLHSGVRVSFCERSILAVNINENIAETLDGLRNGFSGVIPGAIRPVMQWQIARTP